MKRKEFIKELIKSGCYLERHGKKHDVYINPKNGYKAPVPRHNELKNQICTAIKNQLGL